MQSLDALISAGLRIDSHPMYFSVGILGAIGLTWLCIYVYDLRQIGFGRALQVFGRRSLFAFGIAPTTAYLRSGLHQHPRLDEEEPALKKRARRTRCQAIHTGARSSSEIQNAMEPQKGSRVMPPKHDAWKAGSLRHPAMPPSEATNQHHQTI